MTDDLEPRLRDHLRQRASRVSASPDVADVHQRIEGRARRRSRALGTALAVALVAGPVAGYALAQATEPDTDTVSASGGDEGGATGSFGGDSDGRGVLLEGSGAGYFDGELQPVSERTTGDGIRLVVRSTPLGAPQSDPCAVDGVVRVGIVDGDLIDVVLVESAPGNATFGIAGAANGRPMWVVVARSLGTVDATFPNGSVDRAEPVNGVAVLAAYADEGQLATELGNDVVEVTGLPGRPVEEGPRSVTLSDGTGGCGAVLPPIGPPSTMPAAGEPPPDEEAARAEITDLFTAAYDGEVLPSQSDLRERPAVWEDAQQRFRDEHPEYVEFSREVYAEVHDVVFTAPDRASVRFSLVSDNPSVPAPGEQVGEAVLVDGTWKVAIETSCALVGLAGIECDYSIEG